MPKLVHHAGPFEDAVFSLEHDELTLGRSADCAICIPHRSLSRVHARLERREGRFTITDLESKNGVRVNGEPVDRRALRDGDRVQLGDVVLRFVGDAPASLQSTTTITPSPLSALAPAPSSAPADLALAVGVETATLAELIGQTTLGALRVGARDAEQRAQHKLEILLQVGQILSSPEHAGRLLERIVELVFQVFEVDRAALLLEDEETGQLTPRVVRAARDGLGEDQQGISQHIVDYVSKHSVAALFADALSDPRLSGAESVMAQSIRASMCAPLRPKDRVIGVLYVDNLSAPHLFTAEDLRFLVSFAGQAAIAIENAALYRRIEAESVARARLVLEGKLASLSAMMAAIAHELKNPLHFIANFAGASVGLVEELGGLDLGGAAGPAARADADEAMAMLRGNLGKIDEYARRAAAVIDRMQEHAGRTPGPREEVHLSAALEQGAAIALDIARRKGVDFEVAIETEHDPALAPVVGVANELVRVFAAVLENALLAARDQRRALGNGYAPRISVRTAARGAQVEVRVRDNGIGIAPESLPRVFDPFFTTRPPGDGVGLGLSLAHDVIVQGHQGAMRLESEPGERTEVVITLPRGGDRAAWAGRVW